ncbi:hypothetical protein THAOC_19436, partial [Thalassiosira oceanica]
EGTETVPPTSTGEDDVVRVLSEASASDFGSSQNVDEDDQVHDDPDRTPSYAAEDLGGLFQRAFGGRGTGPGGFGMHHAGHGAGPGGFRFYSSTGGGFGHGGHGGGGSGDEEDHNVECSQM